MKRTFIAAAAVLAAGTAMAQSSVQLYGRVNTSVEYQKDGDAKKTVVQNNASRWGLRGSEDLGGGLKAVFLLESGFNSDTGAQTASGSLFGRESWVGVQGNFGRVRMGNLAPTAAYFTTADYVSMHNHDTGTSSDAFYLYTGANGGGVQLKNGIAYNTPSMGGLVLEAQYGLREGGAAAAKNTAAFAANYDRGPLHLGASFVNGPVDLSANLLALSFGGIAGGAVYPDSKEYGLRALYEFGAFTVGGYYVRNQLEGTGLAKVERDTYRLSGMYTLGGSEFHVNVGFADDVKVGGSKAADTSAMQYTVGYNYNLSKRTKVYAFYTKVDNDARVNYSSSAIGRDFSSIALGVRHNF